jgi:hypothetical protein
MNIAKFQPVHAVVANVPMIVSVMADQGISTSRIFFGGGAADSSGHLAALLAGNGKYNAALAGWIVSAVLVGGGSGYAVGDTYSVGACTIMIDSVNAGAIVDFHVTAYGNYSGGGYPPATIPVATTVISGSGAGATFYLNWPQPDFYIDMTAPTAPVLYICTGAGSATGSTWAKISGGGGGGGNYAGTWSWSASYTAGQIVRVESTAVVGGVTPTIGVFGCIATVPANGTGNQIPQYPEPTGGTKYWQLIAFGVQATGTCNGTTSAEIYVNASAPF